MTLHARDHIGLALLEQVLASPRKVRPPNNPLNLLTLEFDHDHSDSQPDSADAQPRSRGGRVQRRSAKLS
jgi:hypothetical protein